MQNKNTKDLEQELSSCAQLHTFLESHQENMTEVPVHENLKKYMEEKGISRTLAITRSGLNTIYAYQIFSGKRKPSRDKLICLCFGLGLNAEEVQSFLHDCGYIPLYAKKRRDSIILFALYKKMTLFELNELLYEEDEPLLN